MCEYLFFVYAIHSSTKYGEMIIHNLPSTPIDIDAMWSNFSWLLVVDFLIWLSGMPLFALIFFYDSNIVFSVGRVAQIQL